MKAGQLLERVLAHLPEAPARAGLMAEELGRKAVWDDAKALGLRPLLSHYLPSLFPLPAEERYSGAFRHARMAWETLQASQLLERAGVPAIALKGVALGTRLYPEPWLRPTSDIDLLIEYDRFAPATAALTRGGWTPLGDLPKTPFRFDHDLGFVAPGKPKLELHFVPTWSFQARFDTAALFRRAVKMPLENGAVSVLAPEDELVHLCAHAAGDTFEGVKWLFDLKLVSMGDRLDWTRFVARARETHVARAVGMALHEARRRLNAPIPGFVLSALAPGVLRRQIARTLDASIPSQHLPTRRYALELLLADGLSRDWMIRLVGPFVNRAARFAGVEHWLDRLEGIGPPRPRTR